MTEATTHVGLDVHKQSISVAMLLPGSAKALQWEMRNEPAEVRRLVRRLRRDAGGGAVLCAYEAGPCGYVLQRQLGREGVACQVVAASLIPRKPGERIKTDRRDARKLADLLRAGLLTEVRPPTEAEEALRDLCRCREDARTVLSLGVETSRSSGRGLPAGGRAGGHAAGEGVAPELKLGDLPWLVTRPLHQLYDAEARDWHRAASSRLRRFASKRWTSGPVSQTIRFTRPAL
jgi:transposase